MDARWRARSVVSRVGTTMALVISRIRFVTPAATARAISGSLA